MGDSEEELIYSGKVKFQSWGDSRRSGPWVKLQLDNHNDLEPLRQLDITGKMGKHVLCANIHDEFSEIFEDMVQVLDWGETRRHGTYLKVALPDSELLDPFRGYSADKTLTAQITLEQQIKEKEPEHKPYSEEAQKLWQSGFIDQMEVIQLIGSDDDFAHWIQYQKCCICGSGDYVQETGELMCEAAHVRRAGESGTAYKQDYSRVPMCHKHHYHQHQQGELFVFLERYPEEDEPDTYALGAKAKEWFDKKALEYLRKWVWEGLKRELGHEHWYQVPPELVTKWAKAYEVEKFLPRY